MWGSSGVIENPATRKELLVGDLITFDIISTSTKLEDKPAQSSSRHKDFGP
jgi:CO dehydrogenase/acetyl-CoA synthase delta subunit